MVAQCRKGQRAPTPAPVKDPLCIMQVPWRSLDSALLDPQVPSCSPPRPARDTDERALPVLQDSQTHASPKPAAPSLHAAVPTPGQSWQPLPSERNIYIQIHLNKTNQKTNKQFTKHNQNKREKKCSERFLGQKSGGLLQHPRDAEGSRRGRQSGARAAGSGEARRRLPSAGGLSPGTPPSSAPCAAPRAAPRSPPWPSCGPGRSPRWLCGGGQGDSGHVWVQRGATLAHTASAAPSSCLSGCSRGGFLQQKTCVKLE